MAETNESGKARLVLDYVKVLAWPVLLVGALVAYRPPLGRVVNSLAEKLENASKVSLGSFSVEVAERAKEVGNPELAKDIGELSAAAVTELMGTPRNGSMILLSTSDYQGRREFGLPTPNEVSGLSELEEKELIRFDEPLAGFLSYLNELPKMPDASYRTRDRVWYLVTPQADSVRLRRFGYRLTDRGRAAAEAITRAVAAQLAVR